MANDRAMGADDDVTYGGKGKECTEFDNERGPVDVVAHPQSEEVGDGKGDYQCE